MGPEHRRDEHRDRHDDKPHGIMDYFMGPPPPRPENPNAQREQERQERDRLDFEDDQYESAIDNRWDEEASPETFDRKHGLE